MRENIYNFAITYSVYTCVATLLALPLVYACAVIDTSRVYGHYPGVGNTGYGLFKMSLNKTTNRGQVGVASNLYDPEIVNAFTRIRSSTAGYSDYMPSSIWPQGFNLVMNNWSGTWNANVDILLYLYAWNPADQWEGQTYNYTAPSAYCAVWGQTYPCGTRPTIEMNTNYWNKPNHVSDPRLKHRVVMHEIGHAVGMRDYCGGDSIMNNGLDYPVGSGNICNPLPSNPQKGKWLDVMSYQATDRAQISSIYR